MKAIACLSLALLGAAPLEPVTLFVASSLKEAAAEIGAEAEKKTGNRHVFQSEATSTLARQINEGAPADVLISAAPEWLDKVRTIERFDWLSNRLVVVALKEAKDFDLKKIDSLALANEQVPVGKYARQALAKEGIAIPSNTIYGQNVRDVLSKVSQGGAKAGIVYATDAAIDPEVKIVHAFPPGHHDKILYSVGLLTPKGKATFDLLKEPWALEIAKKRGFSGLK